MALAGCCAGSCLVAASWGSCLIGGPRAAHFGDLSFCGPRALGHTGFSSRGSWALVLGSVVLVPWLELLQGMCDPPRPAEMEPVSPASAGGFFPTGPTREALVLYTHTCICFYFYFLAVPGTQLQHSASAIFTVACRIFLVISCLTRDRTVGPLLRECWNLSHWATRQFPEASFLTP